MKKQLFFCLLLLVLGYDATGPESASAAGKRCPAGSIAPANAAPAEEEIALERDFGMLRGTLLTPDGGSETAVLIIAGSGPTDRNGNNATGIATDCYRLLAEALADRGIASLRYDKRAIAASPYNDPEAVADVVLEDFVSDAAALAEELSSRGFRRIVLAGHSEGGLIALLAAQATRSADAVVTLAGPGYPFDEILRLQLAGQLLPGHMDLLMEADEIIDALKRGERVETTYSYPGLATLFNPRVQPFLISLLRYDPREVIRNTTLPVLIVNGDRDLQVSADNAEALAAAQPRARKTVIAGMNHTLKHSEGTTLQDQQAAYTDPSLPLADPLVPAIAEFIESLPAPAGHSARD